MSSRCDDLSTIAVAEPSALKISIAMTTYNGARYVEAQLASLVSQTLLPYEIIVCDDVSTDNTVEVVRRFSADSAVPIKLQLNPKSLGWAANFMAAAALCSGDLIAFCDQDDVWYPQKLATVIKFFEDPDTVMVCHDAAIVDADLNFMRPLMRLPPNLTFFKPLELSPWSNALGFTQVIRRRLLQQSNLWRDSLDHDRRPSPMAHDQWFSFLASVLGTMVYIPDALASYRQHGKNAVGNELPEEKTKFSMAKFRSNLAVMAAQADAAAARHHVLTLMSAQVEGAELRLVQAAIDKYAGLTERLRLRAKIYSASSVMARCASLSRLISRRCYSGKDEWKFGLRHLVKDLAIGIPLGTHVGATGSHSIR